MTIQLTKDTYVAGVLSAAGSQHTLDAQTESYLVHIGAATWVDAAYTQGRFEDAKIEYDSDGVAVGIVGRANEVVGPVWAKDASGNVTGLVGPGVSIPLGRTGGNRFVLMGDSITTQNYQTLTVTALSRSAGVVTATATGHSLVDGQNIRINGATTEDFNGVYSITRTSADAFTYVSAGSDGSATLTSNFQCLKLSQQSSSGYWWMLNSKFGGGLYMAGITAAGGATSTDVLDQVTEAKTYLPTHAIILTGVNDVIVGTATATITANLEATYRAMLSAGATVVAVSILPLGSAHASDSLAKSVKILEINRWIRAFCAQTVGMVYVDAYSSVVDPVSATAGDWKTNYTTDGVHPQPIGAMAIATAIHAQLSNIFRAPSPLVCSNADNYGTDAGSKVIWDQSPWVATTGGTASGGTTGDIAAGWTVGESGNVANAAVCTVDARSDGFGYDQTIVGTPAASGDLYYAEGSVTTTRAAAGDYVSFAVEVTISGAAGANLMGMYAMFKQVVGGVSGFAYSQSNAANEARSGLVDGTYTLVTPPTLLQTGFTALTWQVRATCDAAGTALTMKIGKVSVIKNLWAS